MAYVFKREDFGFTDAELDNFDRVIITTLPADGLVFLDADDDGVSDEGEGLDELASVTIGDINLGNLVFAPGSNENGTGYASFTFQVGDDGGTADGGADLDPTPNTITFNVTSVPDSPTGITAHSDNILLSDNFDDGNADGFTLPSGFDGTGGNINSGSDNAARQVAFYNDPAALSWTDVSFSTDITAGDDDPVGVALRYQDADNFVFLFVSQNQGDSPRYRIFSVSGGVESFEAGVDAPEFLQTEAFTLTATVIGDDYSLQVNGTEVLTATIAGHDTGTIGVATDFSINNAFDNVLVTEPELSVPENAATDTVVGNARGFDNDPGDTLTYSLTETAGGRFKIDASGEISVDNGSLLDFETASIHTITIQIDDGTTTPYTEDFVVTVTDVNEAPVLVGPNPSLGTITEDETSNQGQTVSFLLNEDVAESRFSDADGDPEGIAIIVNNNDFNGRWQFQRAGESTWTDVGVVSNNAALLLEAADRVRFLPDGENGDDANLGFRAWDGTEGTAGTKYDIIANGGTGESNGFSTNTVSAQVSITSVNDAPVLDNTGDISLNTQAEDAGPPTGAVGTLISDLVSLDTGTENVTDVDNGATTGVAITAADTANGTFFFTTNGGSTWVALGGVSDSAARVLRADSNTRIYFQSDPNFNGTVTEAVTFRAWDRTQGDNGTQQDASTNGGTTAFSSDTETADVTITAVNDAPVIAGGPGTSTLAETDAGLTDSGTFTVSDVDTSDTVTAAVASVAVTGTASSGLPSRLDNAALQAFLSVSPTEVLSDTQTTNALTWNFSTGTEAFNFLAEGETLILTYTVRITDDAGTPLSDTETVTVTITGTNDAPAIAQLSSADDDVVAAYDFEDGTDSIAPGGPAVTVNSPVTISDTAGFTTGSNGLLFPTGDVDSSTNPVSIGTIPGVAISNAFSFTAQVRFDAGDGDRSFERIFDFGGREDFNNLILTRDQSTNDLLLAIRRAGTVTGNLYIADALDGIEGEFHQYGVTLDDTGLAKVFIDGIEVGSIDVGASGIPNYGTWDENYIGSSNFPENKRFQGAIDDIGIFDRALTASEMASLANTSTSQAFAVDETAPETTSAGFVHGGDADGDPVTYSITSQEYAGAFAIDTSTGEITVADRSALDFESDTAHDVVVSVSDGIASSEETVTIQINDKAEATQTVPGAQILDEDGELTFNTANGNAVTVSDSLAGSEVPLQVRLSVTDGVLNLSGVAGLTIVEGSDGSGSIAFSGTESAINAALEGLRFTPDADFNGGVTLDMDTAIASSVVDLEGFYTFEGGDAENQATGSTGDGVLEGDATTTLDPERGEVLSLDRTVDGDRDFVAIPSLFDQPASVTLAAFINPNLGNDQDVISLGNNVALRVLADGRIQGTFYDGSGFNFATSVDTVSDWSLVALTFDDAADALKLYIDGLEVQSTVTTNSIAYGLGTDTIIGAHGDNDETFDYDGLIDDARVYSRALSTDEIVALAADADAVRGSVAITATAVNDAPVVTSPVSAYSFTEQGSLAIQGTGFSISDADDNGNALTAVFTVGEGRVLIDPTGSGVTVSAGNSTDTVTFSGTKDQINSLLDGSFGTITYLNDQTVASDTPSASTAITLTVNDQGNTGSDPGTSGNATSEEGFATQTINITSVNDAPTFLGSELITNGDLASGDLTGFTTTGSVDIDNGEIRLGENNDPGENSVSQTINTVAGEIYNLTFDYGDFGGSQQFNQALEVAVNSSASNLLTTETILSDIQDNVFVRYTFTFTADSSSATITFTDTSDSADSMSNDTTSVDGRLDNISVKQTGGLLSVVGYAEDNPAVVLDSERTLFDAEISTGRDSFFGTVLTLNRAGGANGDDRFVATGNLVFDGTTATLSGEQVAGHHGQQRRTAAALFCQRLNADRSADQ